MPSVPRARAITRDPLRDDALALHRHFGNHIIRSSKATSLHFAMTARRCGSRGSWYSKLPYVGVSAACRVP